MIELNTIYNEDCLETMRRMPDGFVDLTVTSPPYDNLRTYKGYSFDFEGIAEELVRTLKHGGVIVWVVGDQTKQFSETLTSFRQVLYFNELGLNLLDTMIYHKQSYAPAYPTLRRYANQFEYMFVLTKGKPKTFNPIQKPKARNKSEKRAYRQADGSLLRKTTHPTRETKDASNVWSYPVGGNKLDHPAVFPEQLASDHIKTWSEENDTIYDPFMGSGTTAKACQDLNRNYIGSEISKEYCDIAERRLGQEVLL